MSEKVGMTENLGPRVPPPSSRPCSSNSPSPEAEGGGGR